MRIQTRFFIFVLMCGSTAAMAQPTNTVPLPNNPPVGIGTQLSGGTLNALHIHYDPSKTTLPAILRLSEGDSTGSSAFGVLGLMPAPPATTT
ncbi:MAG TPA: hypothetical protein VG537_09295, partial [Candidatus Kapabacteria bacterium]|nr:hypothetical protein [Candidatus Kapabacteria bacterium]